MGFFSGLSVFLALVPAVFALDSHNGRPDVHIEFMNECGFDVNFAWYQTIDCVEPKPNVLYLNERVASGQSTSRTASVVPFVGGRIYAWAAEDQSPGEGMSEDVFAQYMSLTHQIDRCSATYEKYFLDAPPMMSWGAFAELTFSHHQISIINDADISMVDGFYLPMSFEFIGATGGVTCYNTSMTAFPDQTSCVANGGGWTKIPATPYPGAPTGFCKSPGDLCVTPEDQPVCSDNFDNMKNLIAQLEKSWADLQNDTVGKTPAFTWMRKERQYFPGQVWRCTGFHNAPKFALAEMCAAINRGLCDFSRLGNLSTEDFLKWNQEECGLKQNQQPPETWFVEGFVRNPYAYWLRRTLQGTVYSFSLDEGAHGGNSQCNNLQPGNKLPDYSRVVACPRGHSPKSSLAPPGWLSCGAFAGPCCNPYTAAKQVCPGGQPCQECGGGDSCQCPMSNVSASLSVDVFV